MQAWQTQAIEALFDWKAKFLLAFPILLWNDLIKNRIEISPYGPDNWVF